MRIFKRIICVVLILAICLPLHICAFAITDTVKPRIITALQAIEDVKDDMGLSGMNFEEFTVSDPIYTYEYTPDGFIQNHVMYALHLDGKLTALAISLDRNGNEEYQITTNLIDEMNAVLKKGMSVAIIYDREGCYLYDGESFYLLARSTEDVAGRLTLLPETNPVSVDVILTDPYRAFDLGYTPEIKTRVQTYYSCPVSDVRQTPYAYICWAASIACIVNYKKGTKYTAVDVAKGYYGNDFNQPLNRTQVGGILSNTYGVEGYTYQTKKPGDGVIGHNIKNNFPVIGVFSVEGQSLGHEVVIYGIDVVAGRISIMDPERGFCYVSVSSAGYRYTPTDSGVTLTLIQGICRYWTA